MGVFEAIDAIFNVAILNGGFDLPIALTNVEFDETQYDAWLEATLLPAPVVQASLGVVGCDKHSGIYQIDVNYKPETGVSTMRAKADEINAVFKSGAVFTDGNFNIHLNSVSVGRVVVAGGWATISISIEYWLQNLRG